MTTWTLLVYLTLKSTMVLALAWVIALALGRRSAAARSLVWTAAFATLLALPLLSISLPPWSHPFANRILPADSGVTFRAGVAARESAEATTQAAPARSHQPAPAASAPLDLRAIAATVWAAGVLLFLLHMFGAYVNVWRLRRASSVSPHDPAEFGIDEPVLLLEMADGMPMTSGVFQPTIFLPAESAGWSWERLRLVVAHEYAHVRRGDAAAQLLARAALCLHWFNPLAWVAWRELLKERERAADDLVLSSGALASDYAGHLLEIARSLQSAPVSATAGIAMARRSQLEGRLLAILDDRVKRANPGRASAAVALLAALAIAAPLATVRAQSQAEQKLPADIVNIMVTANAEKNHEMLEQAAGKYEDLRQFEEAQKLREAALAIRKAESTANYAVGLIRLGDLARQRNLLDEAMGYYQRAVELGDMPETAPALISLGLDAAYRGKNLPAAIDYLQRASSAAREPNEIGRALTWLALLKASDPARSSDAESTYRTALMIEEHGSAAQALTTELLARYLRSQDRGNEAEPLEARAKEIRTKLASGSSPDFPGAAVSSAVKVGPGVTGPKLLHKVEPQYSEEARALKYAATVFLKVVIDVDGRAKDIRVIQSAGLGLDEKAVQAVAKWRFQPAESGGVPVPAQAQIEVNFRMM
jgi:TonB family protein